MTKETAQENNRLIHQIIDREEEMFRSIRTRERSPCQDRPDTFRLMRWMSHSVLSRDTLLSYLSDLDAAREGRRNLMTEKYARMENLIPPLSHNPLIREIASIELGWMADLRRRFPHLVRGEAAAFDRYLRCEYETYSDRTLELLRAELETAKNRNLNLAEVRYLNLFEKLGYTSLEEVERKHRRGGFSTGNQESE